MGTRFHRCGMGSIYLARSSHGDGFVTLLRANRHRDASLRNAHPKPGIGEVFAPSDTRLPSCQIAHSSSHGDHAPFNAHSSGGVGAA